MKITLDLLQATEPDAWNSFYIDQGKEMLDLGMTLLDSSKKQDIHLGLAVVNLALFPEHEENPDSPTELESLNFAEFFRPLSQLLKEKEYAAEALQAIHVCFIHGAKATKFEPVNITPFLADKKLKATAFRILVHAYLQKKQTEPVLELVKKEKSFQSVLFEELAIYASRDYESSAFLPLIAKNLEAKGEAPVRTAVEALWNLLTSSDIDLSQAMAVVIKNEARFGGFTDSNKLIAGYYLKTTQYDDLKHWLLSSDAKQAQRALRGLRMSHLQGISADDFLKKTAMKAQLIARANELNVPSLDEGA